MTTTRTSCDKPSWIIVIVVALIGVAISLVFLFLPQITGTAKSSSSTTVAPNPQPLDLNYWERQNSTFKDSKGNVYTGTVTYIHLNDGNWDVRLWGDDTSGGNCCDIYQSAGFALWFLWMGNTNTPLGMCNSRCNHNRDRTCLLGINYFGWKINRIRRGGVGCSPGSTQLQCTAYDPRNNYLQELAVFQPTIISNPAFLNTDVFIITPALYACDRQIYVMVNGTVEA